VSNVRSFHITADALITVHLCSVLFGIGSLYVASFVNVRKEKLKELISGGLVIGPPHNASPLVWWNYWANAVPSVTQHPVTTYCTGFTFMVVIKATQSFSCWILWLQLQLFIWFSFSVQHGEFCFLTE